MVTIEERRAAVVAEARDWIGTPYHIRGQIKGPRGGADCLTFVDGVFFNCGEIPKLKIPQYSHDFHLHCREEWYLEGKEDYPGLRHFCDELPPDAALLPGDIIAYKFGLCFSHAAIVVKWPRIIHAWCRRPIREDDGVINTTLNKIFEIRELRGRDRPRKLFRPKFWISQ